MATSLSNKLVHASVAESTERISAVACDPSLSTEDLSWIAGEENSKILALIERADTLEIQFIEANRDAALTTGIRMFKEAVRNTDPDYILNLAEGVNVFVARVMQQVEAGEILPMNYMEPNTRKEVFLIESYMRSKTESQEQ